MAAPRRWRFATTMAVACLVTAPTVSLIADAWRWGVVTATLYSALLSLGVSLIILNWKPRR
jgi:uncharacterized phage-associated protein